MVNYQLAKIYKIVCNTTGKIYIGSTCEPTLARRLAKHKGNYISYNKGTTNFVTSFNILENENYEIVLIEDYPCDRKDQLHARERFFIESNETVNKNIPSRTIKEWRELNKENKKENDKQYRELNKEKIKKDKKQYRVLNKEKMKELDKNYRELNKEKIKEYQKEWRTLNRENIILKQNEKRRMNKTPPTL